MFLPEFELKRNSPSDARGLLIWWAAWEKEGKSVTMQQAQQNLTYETTGQGLYELTRDVVDWSNGLAFDTGLLTLYCRHTSASLVIQENADPDVMRDLETFFKQLVPEDLSLYRHRSEGADDMPAHIKGALTQSTLTIPLSRGRLVLGTWQGIFLFEHRAQPHTRNLVLHMVGD
jgi:secondary thiamine-phosphate synthase enzyme